MALGLLIVLIGITAEDEPTGEAAGASAARSQQQTTEDEPSEPVAEAGPADFDQWAAGIHVAAMTNCDRLASLNDEAYQHAAKDLSDTDALLAFERAVLDRMEQVCAEPQTAREPEADPEPEPEPEPAPVFSKGDYADLTNREFSKITRDPDSVGEKVLVFGDVFQFDSLTGPTEFLANVGGDRDTEGEEYGVVFYDHNALLGEGEFPRASFDDVVEGDHFAAWVTVAGSYDYDTQIGGSTTAMMLLVDRIKVLPPVE